YPASLNPWRNAVTIGALPLADVPSRNPITGIAACCARVAIGHATAALPTSVMNSRRLMPSMGFLRADLIVLKWWPCQPPPVLDQKDSSTRGWPVGCCTAEFQPFPPAEFTSALGSKPATLKVSKCLPPYT